MGWGIFNKLKKGFQKIGGKIIGAAKWVNDKVIKPVVKPIMNVAAPIINSFIPGPGTAIQKGVDIGSNIADKGVDKGGGWLNKFK
jgi:hypothetical protein